MKMPSSVKININDVTASMTMVVKIKGIKRFRIKLFIAKILIMLACWVTGFGLKFEDRGAH